MALRVGQMKTGRSVPVCYSGQPLFSNGAHEHWDRPQLAERKQVGVADIFTWPRRQPRVLAAGRSAGGVE